MGLHTMVCGGVYQCVQQVPKHDPNFGEFLGNPEARCPKAVFYALGMIHTGRLWSPYWPT
jgi:hypothetical protein